MSAHIRALVALTLAALLAFLMIGSFSAVQEAAKAELRLSDIQLSLAQGMSAAVLLVALSIPVGALVDRFNRLNLLRTMALIWTLGTLATAYATGPVSLFAARMAASIGIAGALTAAISIAADISAPESRGRTLLILTLGKVAGQAAGFGLTGALYGWLARDWRTTHIALAAIGVALALPLFLMREPARKEVATTLGAPLRAGLGELWKRRHWLLPIFAGGAAVAMADTAAILWAAPVIERRFALPPDVFGGWMAALVFGTGVAGAAIGGLAADWGHKRGRILFGPLIAAALSIPAALFAVMPGVTAFAISLGAFMLAGTIIGLALSVAFTVLLPNELRGLAIGGFLSVSGLAAFGIAPLTVASLAKIMGGDAQLPLALAIVATAVSALSLLCFAQSARHLPKPIG